MIVDMVLVQLVVRAGERKRFLEALGRLGLLHLKPVDPGSAGPDPEILQALEELDRALNILAPLRSDEEGAVEVPGDAVKETLRLWSAVTEWKARLEDLERQVRELALWGDVTLKQLEDLGEAGIELRFFRIPRGFLKEVRVDCLHVAASLEKQQILVAVIDRLDRWTPPPWAEPVDFPPRDRPSLLAEAAQIHENIRKALRELSVLAQSTGTLEEERRRLAKRLEMVTAQKSGLMRGELFAVQGWVPEETAGNLPATLAREGITAGLRILPVPEDETPPTLIRYPSWALPMKGLFDMLGTLPGYRETDLSPFFMVALPIFAALLVSDAGYGFLLTLAGLIFHGRLARAMGKHRVQLLVVFGVTSLVWGVLTANYFGITPEILAVKGGFTVDGPKGTFPDYPALWRSESFPAQTAKAMIRLAPLWREDPAGMRWLLIQVSLVLGCLHLLAARLRRLLELFPDQRALAELGWMVVIVDVLVLIRYLLFVGLDRLPSAVWWVMGGGFVVIAFFAQPGGNVLKRFGIGLASSLLPLLSTFGDTMSYLRLFAVGLASTYIAGAFNLLGGQLAGAAGWFAALPVLVFGHALNMALAAVAVFAHGVRLNMLEFSNATGVQWSGYAYRPFSWADEAKRGE